MAFACHLLSVPILAASSVLHLERRGIQASLGLADGLHLLRTESATRRQTVPDHAAAAYYYTAAATAAVVAASGLVAAVVGVASVFLHGRLTATSNAVVANSLALGGIVIALLVGSAPMLLSYSAKGAAGSIVVIVIGAIVFIGSACVYLVAGAPDGPSSSSSSSALKLRANGLYTDARDAKSARLSAARSHALLAKPISLRLVVITGGTRVDSLYRLLDSLCKLESDGDRIDLDVWIDVPEQAEADLLDSVFGEKRLLAQDVEMLGRNGTYQSGLVRAHIWEQHMGLRGQWLDAWHASIPGGLQEDTQEIGLILEDDMQLSPFAWRWLKAAYAAYGRDPRVAGFTVQRATLCLARCPNINGGPDGAGGGFYYGLIGTWGYSPTARSFARFRRWYYSLPPNFKPYVEGATPTDWYKSFEKAGTEKVRMWEMHHIKYTDTHEDKYTVYAKCKNNATLGVNHRETGLNFDGKDPAKKGAMHAMLTEWDPDLIRFAQDPFVLNYSAAVVEGLGVAGGLLVTGPVS